MMWSKGLVYQYLSYISNHSEEKQFPDYLSMIHSLFKASGRGTESERNVRTYKLALLDVLPINAFRSGPKVESTCI